MTCQSFHGKGWIITSDIRQSILYDTVCQYGSTDSYCKSTLMFQRKYFMIKTDDDDDLFHQNSKEMFYDKER